MKRIIITFSIFLLAAAMVVVFLYTSIFSVKDIEVESELISESEIRVLSGVRAGRNIFMLRTDTVEQELLKDPRIDRVIVEKKYPNKLIIRVNERNPYAAVRYHGHYLVLDETARVIEMTTNNTELPLITGFNLTRASVGEHIATSDSALFAQALNIVQLVYQTDLKEVEIAFQDSQVVLYPHETLQVKFGRVEDVERQFSNFMEVYRQLQAEDSLVGIIDVSNVDMAVYKPF